jgi:hypothetical protein
VWSSAIPGTCSSSTAASAAWRLSGSDIEILAGQSILIQHGMRVHFLCEPGSGKGLVSGDFRVDP